LFTVKSAAPARRQDGRLSGRQALILPAWVHGGVSITARSVLSMIVMAPALRPRNGFNPDRSS
jgi:hypothetical protein